jgi:hypothetical protein
MKPILTVEFDAKAGDYEYKEESVPLHSPEELFEFVAPGGGCENIPSEVEEIRMVFLSPEHRNTSNPIADAPAMLQVHMVVFTGSLSAISQTAEQIIDKAGRGELSDSFLKVIGLGS